MLSTITTEQLTYIKLNFLVPYRCTFRLHDWDSEERKISWTGWVVHVSVYEKNKKCIYNFVSKYNLQNKLNTIKHVLSTTRKCKREDGGK
jgi:hypothetical protein